MLEAVLPTGVAVMDPRELGVPEVLGFRSSEVGAMVLQGADGAGGPQLLPQPPHPALGLRTDADPLPAALGLLPGAGIAGGPGAGAAVGAGTVAFTGPRGPGTAPSYPGGASGSGATGSLGEEGGDEEGRAASARAKNREVRALGPGRARASAQGAAAARRRHPALTASPLPLPLPPSRVQAQQRFRARQRERLTEAEGVAGALASEMAGLRTDNADLQRRHTSMARVLAVRDAMLRTFMELQVGGRGRGGWGGCAGAAAAAAGRQGLPGYGAGRGCPVSGSAQAGGASALRLQGLAAEEGPPAGAAPPGGASAELVEAIGQLPSEQEVQDMQALLQVAAAGDPPVERSACGAVIEAVLGPYEEAAAEEEQAPRCLLGSAAASGSAGSVDGSALRQVAAIPPPTNTAILACFSAMAEPDDLVQYYRAWQCQLSTAFEAARDAGFSQESLAAVGASMDDMTQVRPLAGARAASSAARAQAESAPSSAPTRPAPPSPPPRSIPPCRSGGTRGPSSPPSSRTSPTSRCQWTRRRTAGSTWR